MENVARLQKGQLSGRFHWFLREGKAAESSRKKPLGVTRRPPSPVLRKATEKRPADGVSIIPVFLRRRHDAAAHNTPPGQRTGNGGALRPISFRPGFRN